MSDHPSLPSVRMLLGRFSQNPPLLLLFTQLFSSHQSPPCTLAINSQLSMLYLKLSLVLYWDPFSPVTTILNKICFYHFIIQFWFFFTNNQTEIRVFLTYKLLVYIMLQLRYSFLSGYPNPRLSLFQYIHHSFIYLTKLFLSIIFLMLLFGHQGPMVTHLLSHQIYTHLSDFNTLCSLILCYISQFISNEYWIFTLYSNGVTCLMAWSYKLSPLTTVPHTWTFST